MVKDDTEREKGGEGGCSGEQTGEGGCCSFFPLASEQGKLFLSLIQALIVISLVTTLPVK